MEKNTRKGGGSALPLPPPPRLSASSSSSSSIPTHRLPKSAAAAAANANLGDCSTPRSLLSRILQRGDNGFGCRVRLPRYCSSGAGKRGKDNAEEMVEEKEAKAMVKVVEPPRSSLGSKPEDLSMNLGLGVSLIFLLTKSATELNKMMELRTQMEALLLDIRKEMQKNKNFPSSSHESYSTIVKEPIVCANEDAVSNCSRTVDRVVEDSTLSDCGGGGDGGNRGGVVMDQMEAELEVELKRLQFSMNDEKRVLPLQEHGIETKRKSDVSASLSASCVDDDGVKDGEVTEGGDDEEEEKEEEGKSPPHGGVSARELERRLHQLLQTRQQERITELESALECAERKLHEKEREICWWRDTAKLVSQHKDESVFR